VNKPSDVIRKGLLVVAPTGRDESPSPRKSRAIKGSYSAKPGMMSRHMNQTKFAAGHAGARLPAPGLP
jgi:hypothetical protein